MGTSTLGIDPLVALSALYALVVFGVIAVILTALLRIQVGHSFSLRDVFKQTRFLELTTVLVIIISGTYLAFSDKMNEGVISLLSGIAGYVLGGLSSQRRNTDSADIPSPDTPPDQR